MLAEISNRNLLPYQ